MEKNHACCGTQNVTVVACSGGSNVGQITNEVAKRLDADGAAKFFCLAGVGGHIAAMVESVRGASQVLVIDGCSVACAKECMDKAGLANYAYLVVTDLGIDKNRNFALPEADLDKTLTAAYRKITVT